METTVSMPIEEYKKLKLKDLDAYHFKEKIKQEIESITNWRVIVDLKEYDYSNALVIRVTIIPESARIRELEQEVKLLKEATKRKRWQFWK